MGGGMTHPLGLAEIQALYEKATKGPWELHLREDDPDSYTLTGADKELLRKRDAKLITALVNAWPDIAAALREREWMPIETAPKDGTWVLLTGGNVTDDTGEDRPAVAQWTDDLNGRKTVWHWQHCWYDGGYYGRYENPTHWMPLPPSPAGREEK